MVMRRLLSFACILFASHMAYAQGCLPGSVTFDSQEDIDSFAVRYPGCSVVEGDLTIQATDIQNLHGLVPLREVKGNFRISLGFDIPSLAGLDSLVEVGGQFALRSCNSLVDLSGLEQVER